MIVFNFVKKNNNMEKLTIENRLKGSLFGFFVGDALGVPVEFFSREELKEHRIKDMEEFGTHHQPKGTWSDDSSMVIATIDSLNKNDEINYRDIMNNFIKWYKNGEYTPFGEVFDIGNATAVALNKYVNNQEDFRCGSSEVYSNGNGSLMRILPISLYLHYTDDDMYEVVRNISSMTHSHIFSVFSCIIYTVYINELLKENDKIGAYYAMQQIIKNILEDNRFAFIGDQRALKNIFDRLIYHDISKYEEKDIKSSGYVVDTLEAVFWCLLTTENYSDSVLKAVNLGDDTDTVAAITGGLSGLVYGYDSIPIRWINLLKQKDTLDKYVINFIRVLMNDKEIELKNQFDIQILDNVIYALKNDPNACTTIGGMTSVDGSFAIPESYPGSDLRAFMKYFYENGFIDTNYVDNFKMIAHKPIEDYTYDDCLTALTKIFRGDRFISGHIYGCFKNGTLLKVIEQLKNNISF